MFDPDACLCLLVLVRMTATRLSAFCAPAVSLSFVCLWCRRLPSPSDSFMSPFVRPDVGVYNSGFDNEEHDYILYVNDVLTAATTGDQYTVLDMMGTGTFGQVTRCRHEQSSTIVAVKVIKNQPAYLNQAWVEIAILRLLRQNNPQDSTRHIVNLFAHFTFRGHLCLVFEPLSINLFELLQQNGYRGVSLDMLRSFLNQLLPTLDVLRRSEVIHCDLKPENILLRSLNAVDVVLIDFGSACQQNHVIYSYVQSRFYRSPEVLLGRDYDAKIDMWSLGCVAGELFLGIPLFPGQNEFNMVARIVEMLGPPPRSFLDACRHATRFFHPPGSGRDSLRADGTAPSPGMPSSSHAYTLKSTSVYEAETGTTLPPWKRYFPHTQLRDIILAYPYGTAAGSGGGDGSSSGDGGDPEQDPLTSEAHAEEVALRLSFIDLLSGLLQVDPAERWSPAEAMQHPFLTVGALPGGHPWTPPPVTRAYGRAVMAPRSTPHGPLQGTLSGVHPQGPWGMNVAAASSASLYAGSGYMSGGGAPHDSSGAGTTSMDAGGSSGRPSGRTDSSMSAAVLISSPPSYGTSASGRIDPMGSNHYSCSAPDPSPLAWREQAPAMEEFGGLDLGAAAGAAVGGGMPGLVSSRSGGNGAVLRGGGPMYVGGTFLGGASYEPLTGAYMPVRPVVEEGDEDSLEDEPREAVTEAVETWRHAHDRQDGEPDRLASLDNDFPAPPGGSADPREGDEVTHGALFRQMALDDDKSLDPFTSYQPFLSMDLAHHLDLQRQARQATADPGMGPPTARPPHTSSRGSGYAGWAPPPGVDGGDGGAFTLGAAAAGLPPAQAVPGTAGPPPDLDPTANFVPFDPDSFAAADPSSTGQARAIREANARGAAPQPPRRQGQ